MKKKLLLLQILALALTALSVVGLGILVFQGGELNMAAIYILAGLGVTGFIGNGALALLRVLVEKNERDGRP